MTPWADKPVVAVNTDYETWLATQCDVVISDLEKKHEKMRDNVLSFMRASYFRWAASIESVCPTLVDAPVVLAVGDLHLENYGTWRDADGRWVWGVNDFDEAAPMPYAWDLLRLAASVRLAPGLEFVPDELTRFILMGYASGLRDPQASILDGDRSWIRKYVVASAKSADAFRDEVDRYPDASPHPEIRQLLMSSLPEGSQLKRFARRSKGGGGLGRPRFLAIAHWQGGQVIREAKALVPSAWQWAHDSIVKPHRFRDLSNGPYRSPDPNLAVHEGFVVRRLSEDARKLDLKEIAGKGLTGQLLQAMAFDLGAVHAGSMNASEILDDLGRRPDGWLVGALHDCENFVRSDFSMFGLAGST